MQFLKNLSLTEAHKIIKSLDKELVYPSIGTAVYAWDGGGFTSLIYRGVLKEVRNTTMVVDGNVRNVVKFAVADELDNLAYMYFDHVVELDESNKGRKVIAEDFIGHIISKSLDGELVVETCTGEMIHVKPEDVIDFDWEKIKVACAKTND